MMPLRSAESSCRSARTHCHDTVPAPTRSMEDRCSGPDPIFPNRSRKCDSRSKAAMPECRTSADRRAANQFAPAPCAGYRWPRHSPPDPTPPRRPYCHPEQCPSGACPLLPRRTSAPPILYPKVSRRCGIRDAPVPCEQRNLRGIPLAICVPRSWATVCRINGRAVNCSACEPVRLGVLVFAFALVHVAPTELGQVKLVAVGILESHELAGLAVVDHSLELQAFGSESFHGVFNGTVQFEANRHR